MYGIGAVDGNAIEEGAKTAYLNGWTTVEKAIIDGARFIGNNYIKAGQNTLYKMRWNPAKWPNLEKQLISMHQISAGHQSNCIIYTNYIN